MRAWRNTLLLRAILKLSACEQESNQGMQPLSKAGFCAHQRRGLRGGVGRRGFDFPHSFYGKDSVLISASI